MRRFLGPLALVLITAITLNAQCLSKCFSEQCLELIAKLLPSAPPAAPPCHSQQEKEPARESEQCEFAHLAEDRLSAPLKANLTAQAAVFVAPAAMVQSLIPADAGTLPEFGQVLLPPSHLTLSTIIRI